MNKIPLGLKVPTPTSYDSSILFRIEREPQGEEDKAFGADLWTCYETSFLNVQGVPTAGILRWALSTDSKFIVESKSFKLFLGSCNFKQFESSSLFVSTVRETLVELLETDQIEIQYFSSQEWSKLSTTQLPATSLDNQLIPSPTFTYNPEKLRMTKTETPQVQESLYSDLLRSLCPVTAQPDWATVQIDYKGQQICKKSLLSYICSLRNHQGFHESLCQLIYSDICKYCTPERLTVSCFFTRRGGIDITPIRSSLPFSLGSEWRRTIRQ